MDLFDNLLFNYTHNKLYNTEFIRKNSLRFIEWLPIDQDTNFNIDVFRVLNKLTISTKSYYHYVKTFEETIVSRYHANKFEVRTFRYNRLKNLLNDWDIYNEENKKKLALMYIYQVIECFEIYTHDKCDLTIKEKKEKIKDILIDENVQECMNVIETTNSLYTRLIFKAMKSNHINRVMVLLKLKQVLK